MPGVETGAAAAGDEARFGIDDMNGFDGGDDVGAVLLVLVVVVDDYDDDVDDDDDVVVVDDGQFSAL